MDEAFKHIRSLKDLTSVRFTPNPAFEEKEGGSDSSAPFICPITLVEVGRQRFSVLKSCGCAISERALREIPSPSCLQCGKPFNPNDILPLNPSPEEQEELRRHMEEKRTAESSAKKEKKSKKKEGKSSANGSEKTEKEKGKSKSHSESKKRGLDTTSTTTQTTTTTTTSAEPAPKLQKSAAYASIFTSSIKSSERMQETFMCRNVSRG